MAEYPPPTSPPPPPPPPPRGPQSYPPPPGPPGASGRQQANARGRWGGGLGRPLLVAAVILGIFVVRLWVTAQREDAAEDAGGMPSVSSAASSAAASRSPRSSPTASGSAAETTGSDAGATQPTEGGVPGEDGDSTAGSDAQGGPADGAAGGASQAPEEPQEREEIDFVMPNFVGQGLQEAQNGVQKHGLFFSSSRDLRGSRRQVIDSNWQVCEQRPAAGQRVHGRRVALEGAIEFGVVKDSERCP